MKESILYQPRTRLISNLDIREFERRELLWSLVMLNKSLDEIICYLGGGCKLEICKSLIVYIKETNLFKNEAFRYNKILDSYFRDYTKCIRSEHFACDDSFVTWVKNVINDFITIRDERINKQKQKELKNKRKKKRNRY